MLHDRAYGPFLRRADRRSEYPRQGLGGSPSWLHFPCMNRSDVATTVRNALGDVAGGRLRTLPFTLRFWDGSTLAGESPTPVTVVRSPKALAYLLRAPNQIGLARAWVTGVLDVEGDLELGARGSRPLLRNRAVGADRLKLRRRARAAPSVLVARARVPPIEAAPRGRRHSLARDRPPSATTTTSPTTSTGWCSVRASRTRARTSRRPRTRSRTRRSASTS